MTDRDHAISNAMATAVDCLIRGSFEGDCIGYFTDESIVGLLEFKGIYNHEALGHMIRAAALQGADRGHCAGVFWAYRTAPDSTPVPDSYDESGAYVIAAMDTSGYGGRLIYPVNPAFEHSWGADARDPSSPIDRILWFGVSGEW
jgi:hypothetical protein